MEGPKKDEEEEGMAVLDFDMLCATVALQTQGILVDNRGKEEELGEKVGEFGGVERMWEGELLDCFEDRRIAIESACCPCYRFGKNIRRANLGPCSIQVNRRSIINQGFNRSQFSKEIKSSYKNWEKLGKRNQKRGRNINWTFGGKRSQANSQIRCLILDPLPIYKQLFLKGSMYFILVVAVLFNFISFGVTKQHCYLYMGVASAVAFGLYLGYFRTRIRKQFNIRGRDSSLDDCIHHLMCPCCTLCQESRTLEMNNVQDGVWHGRGDTICVGSFGEGSKEFSALHKASLMPTKSPGYIIMDRASNGSNHSWNADANHSEPLVMSNS